MKKLQLNTESIRVESFVTGATAERRGTVYGHHSAHVEESCSCGSTCYLTDCGTYAASDCWPYCDSAETCAQTCACNTHNPSDCTQCEI